MGGFGCPDGGCHGIGFDGGGSVGGADGGKWRMKRLTCGWKWKSPEVSGTEGVGA